MENRVVRKGELASRKARLVAEHSVGVQPQVEHVKGISLLGRTGDDGNVLLLIRGDDTGTQYLYLAVLSETRRNQAAERHYA